MIGNGPHVTMKQGKVRCTERGEGEAVWRKYNNVVMEPQCVHAAMGTATREETQQNIVR